MLLFRLLTLYIPLLSQAPPDTWRYKVTWEFTGSWGTSKTFLPFFCFFWSCMWHLKCIRPKKNSTKQSTFVWQTPSSPHIKSSPYMWYRRGRSIQTEVMRSVFWLNAIIPTPKMKSCGGIQQGRGLLWFHSVYIMPTGRWFCLGPLWLRLLWIMAEMWAGWSSCHSHTYMLWSKWTALWF